MKIAVTGARGFIGRHLTSVLADRGHGVVLVNRDDWDLTSQISPAALLDGCGAVVHLAARAHVAGRPGDVQFLRTMFEANVRGTALLAQAAAEQRVSRFVFLSSAAVYGHGNRKQVIDEATSLHPVSAYGQSKIAAEEALQAIAGDAGLTTVMLRPPLVYGRGAPGNFQTLIRLVSRGVPVPSGALAARRSLISVTNLCDLVACALEADSLPRSAYVAAEPARPIADLYYGLCAASGRRPLVVPFPRAALRLALNIAGRSDMAGTLLDDFAMDASATRRELNWSPQDLFSEELQCAVNGEHRS